MNRFHGGLRNLQSKAPNTKTMPIFTASRSQNWFLKNAEIYTDYDGCHRHHVKHYSYLFLPCQSAFRWLAVA